MALSIAASSLFFALVRGQAAGTQQSETHPSMTWERCSGTGGNSCETVNGEIVIDANWRWLHVVDDYQNCYDGNEWDSSVCSTNEECSENCAVDGADYESTYGISVSGDSLQITFVTEGEYATNIGARTYMLESTNSYQMYELLGQEFTFDVDVSNLPCGLNGALYFVNMPQEGQGEAGAEYGTGYCDSQCPRDLKFIDGTANMEGWQPSDNDPNAGVGDRGACCAEMDIWEANSISTAVTPHSCDTVTFTECSGDQCGGTYSGDRYAGNCDPNGCDFNPYRVGATDFYGPGKTVDTNQQMTVVTQFLEEGGTLSEIKRYYVQGGETIPNAYGTIAGLEDFNSVTQEFCEAEQSVFQEADYPFFDHGGMASISEALQAGMVLVMSLWDDHYANMLWLDAPYPTDRDPSEPGVARGDCDTGSGVPADVESQNADASVTFSAIKVGPIGSTFDQGNMRKRNLQNFTA
ncbi:exoglucanase-like protein 1 precursor [Lineolata rhizophorae]|uniref:Glucanase n=1 Tax=Lineolata rhizophorae TaxID=578093 RepID=A0A6A6NRN8_9PEZI|nr:exoglucanase-like protein 1 precursor [Lineolata rhizophorae]